MCNKIQKQIAANKWSKKKNLKLCKNANRFVRKMVKKRESVLCGNVKVV